MALQPRLQALSELEIAEHHGDHQRAPRPPGGHGPRCRRRRPGPGGHDPRGGRLYTAERERVGVFAAACRDRDASRLGAGLEAVSPAELQGFPPGTHPENVALALAARGPSAPRAALAGMRAAALEVSSRPDLDLSTSTDARSPADAFAANDLSSSLRPGARPPRAPPRVHGGPAPGQRTPRPRAAHGPGGGKPWLAAVTRALFLGGGWQLFACASRRGRLERARRGGLRAPA
ncbi:MAG: hypothetical protein R3F62_10805 [Planctomycetota bacterium]